MNLVTQYLDAHPKLQQCLVHLAANIQIAVEAVAKQAPDVHPEVIKMTIMEEIQERQQVSKPDRQRWHLTCAPGSPGHEAAKKLGLVA